MKYILVGMGILSVATISISMVQGATGLVETPEIVLNTTDINQDIEYIYFGGKGCAHCVNVEAFFQKEGVEDIFNIEKKEIVFDKENLQIFFDYLERFGLPTNKVGTPFLVIEDGEDLSYLMGDTPIIDYFKDALLGTINNGNQGDGETTLQSGNFFRVLLPAALADAINPCAFAVLLILLTAILAKKRNKKKVLLAGLLFSLTIFVMYFLFGIGLFSALASAENTIALKRIVGILGILIGLFNLKDYFWPDKLFVMEVPMAWRPKMHKIIQSITSPRGAVGIGVVISLFLLPCTSGPYLTILGLLASEQSYLNIWAYIYLFAYNLIFILPMVIITLLIYKGKQTVECLAKLRKEKRRVLHLIVGLLMLGLGLYVLITI